MKFRKWLKEVKQISYKDYKNLSWYERCDIREEHEAYCIRENRVKIRARENWRPATSEESERYRKLLEQEMERYRISEMIGGTSGNGYTALHHRWESSEGL